MEIIPQVIPTIHMDKGYAKVWLTLSFNENKTNI